MCDDALPCRRGYAGVRVWGYSGGGLVRWCRYVCMLTQGRIYASAQAKVRCRGGVGMVRDERGAQWRWQVMVDGGRYVRGRVSEFIGTYLNLSEEIRWVRISSD